MKAESESEVAQSCLTLHDPMDCSLPGSSIHGIFQARVLEWGTIAFSPYPGRCRERNKEAEGHGHATMNILIIKTQLGLKIIFSS